MADMADTTDLLMAGGITFYGYFTQGYGKIEKWNIRGWQGGKGLL